MSHLSREVLAVLQRHAVGANGPGQEYVGREHHPYSSKEGRPPMILLVKVLMFPMWLSFRVIAALFRARATIRSGQRTRRVAIR